MKLSTNATNEQKSTSPITVMSMILLMVFMSLLLYVLFMIAR